MMVVVLLIAAAFVLVAVAGVQAEDPVVRALRELQTTTPSNPNPNPSGDTQLQAVLHKIASALKCLSKRGVPVGELPTLET